MEIKKSSVYHVVVIITFNCTFSCKTKQKMHLTIYLEQELGIFVQLCKTLLFENHGTLDH